MEVNIAPNTALYTGPVRITHKTIHAVKHQHIDVLSILVIYTFNSIKMTVTFSKASALDAIFAPTGADLISIFNGYDSAANWIYKGNTKDATADTRTYEFWYKETVGAPNADVALDALFDSITVPGEITKEQLATIAGMTITVNAYAIQADGFADAEAAWNAFA